MRTKLQIKFNITKQHKTRRMVNHAPPKKKQKRRRKITGQNRLAEIGLYQITSMRQKTLPVTNGLYNQMN